MNLPGTLLLEISEVVPSNNRLLRMHWAQRRKLAQKWQWLVWLEVFRLGFPSLPPGKLAVRITRRSHHRMDADNLAGSAKIVLDALRYTHLIADDSPAHITLTCEQESGHSLTRIQLTAASA